MNGELNYANNLSEAFDVDIRPILERAADQQLSARKFEDATLLYRLSKVNQWSLYLWFYVIYRVSIITVKNVIVLLIFITDESIETCS